MKKEINEIDFPAKLTKHFQIHEHTPEEKFDHRGFTVYLSQGGPYHQEFCDCSTPIFTGSQPKSSEPCMKCQYPLGWYESSFTLHNKDVMVYQPLVHDYLHDMELTEEGRRSARTTAARKAALENIDAFRNESH